MLPKQKYLKKFSELQKLTVSATDNLTKWISPGQTEKEVADKYYSLLSEIGFEEHWYPILVYSGEITSKPISRRIHLPSDKIIIKKNDIVFVDSTPMKETIWSNWCDTVVIGSNTFYQRLIDDTKQVVNKTAGYARNNAKTVGELYKYSLSLINKLELKILDPYNDIGHSIFQVNKHQTVDKTPMKDRLLLNNTFKNSKLEGIISIEPQLGRKNPENGKLYGAKLQEVVIY